MSGLAFAQAPPPSLPVRFLLAAPGWGVVAGGWLAWQGEAALLSRWTPATLVLVHLLALGLLGNAMLGSLVQFLPVAAGSPLPCIRLVPWLHVAFNAGIALLLATLATHDRLLALPAMVVLGGSLLLFALLAGIAVLRGKGARVVRDGIGLSVVALLATVALGASLLAARTGWRAPASPGLVDLHAVVGGVGWGLGLLAAVGGVAVPMLQGTRAVPTAWSRAWQAGWLGTIGIVVAAQAGALPRAAWQAAAWPFVAFAIAVLVLHARAPHRRNPMLRGFWRGGSAALLAGGVAGMLPAAPDMLTGTLILGAGLPLLVAGMALEITAFLAWIALRQRVPRGTRVPGVGRLSEEPGKRRVLVAHGIAAALLVAAIFAPMLARAAGGAMALACALGLHAQWRCWRTAATWSADADGARLSSAG